MQFFSGGKDEFYIFEMRFRTFGLILIEIRKHRGEFASK